MAGGPKKVGATRPARSGARVQAKSRAVPLAARGKPEIRIFVSYSHADVAARTKLETHLAALKRDDVTTWFDGDLNAGDALDTNIARELRRAHIFVALFSPDYLASHYCWEIEYKRAMSRRARGELRVVAVVVRPSDWKATRAARFKLLPTDGRPVTRWRTADDAYLNVAEGIRAVVTTLRMEMATKTTTRKTAAPAKRSGSAATKVPTKTGGTKKVSKPRLRAKSASSPRIARRKSSPARPK